MPLDRHARRPPPGAPVRTHASDDDQLVPNVVRLAVCDTLAGRWDVLPELDCDSQFCYSDTYGYTIIPSSSGGDDRRAFRVLLIGADKYESESQFNLHRFASSDRSWSAPRKCFDMMERHIWSMKEENAVVCRGNAHWLFVRASNQFHVLIPQRRRQDRPRLPDEDPHTNQGEVHPGG